MNIAASFYLILQKQDYIIFKFRHEWIIICMEIVILGFC